jgi:serine/threonine protein kinase
MAVASVNEYLAALEKSKLLGGEQLANAQSLAGHFSSASDLARALARDNFLSRWQAGTILALGKRAQLRLGKYRLIQRLGKGGMGTVFLAEHVTMNRRVALKIVPRSIAKNRASLDRFFAEARAIASLDHPNIVQAYSVDNEMDRYFIVMEYIDGQDLQRIVDTNGPLDFERAADYVRQAAEGLAHAHARNLVHCDVKPSNLLVTGQGVIKILDLGLARLNQSDDGQESSEPAMGTVDYMLPEQALGAADFDNRADIYSLGCTLYFLLTGHPPFPEGTLAQRIIKHQTQPPRDILLDRRDTPLPLAKLCQHMMAKRPEDRCQSMQEVSAAIAPSAGQTADSAVSIPRAVKLIAEPTVGGQADDWLTAMVREASGSAATDSSITRANKSGGVRSVGRSDTKLRKARSGGNQSPALSGRAGLVAAGLAWFNTTPRIMLGAACVAVALAAVATLAAVPLLFSPPPAGHAPSHAGEVGDSMSHVDETTPVGDTSSDKKPASSASVKMLEPPAKTPLGTAGPAAVAEAVNNVPPKPIARPQPDVPPKPPANPTTPIAIKPLPQGDKSKPLVVPSEVVKKIALDGLLSAVDLPPAKDSSAAVSLGKLESPAKTDFDIQILGGDTIAKGNPRFTVRKETDSAAWSIVLVEKSKNDLPIARLVVAGGECKFQWTTAAKDRASLATLARFCGLQFSSGGSSHVTVLTAPKAVAPLVIDLDVATNRSRHISREFNLPDPSLLRLQVLPLDASIPKHEIKAVDKGRAVRLIRGRLPETNTGDTIMPRGRTLIVLTKERWPQVTFQFEFNAHGRDASLESIQATYSGAAGTLPFESGEVDARARFAAFIVASADTGARGSRKPPSKEVIQDAKSVGNECKALEVLLGELRHRVSIPFRIYLVAGAADDPSAPKVVIFQANQVERATPAQPKKTKNGKGQKG